MAKRTRLFWSNHDDQLLVQYVTNKQVTKWSELGKQCKERWVNNLDPKLKKTHWNEEEDQLLIYLQSTMGNKWTQIATGIPGRSENDVKNRWHSSINKKRKFQNLPEQTSITATTAATMMDTVMDTMRSTYEESINQGVSVLNEEIINSTFLTHMNTNQYYKLDMLKAITAHENNQYHYHHKDSFSSLLTQLPHISELSPFVFLQQNTHCHEDINHPPSTLSDRLMNMVTTSTSSSNTTSHTTNDSVATQDTDFMLSSIADMDNHPISNQLFSNKDSSSNNNNNNNNIYYNASTTTTANGMSMNFISPSTASSGRSTPSTAMYNVLFSACNSPNWLQSNTGNNSPDNI